MKCDCRPTNRLGLYLMVIFVFCASWHVWNVVDRMESEVMSIKFNVGQLQKKVPVP